MRKRNHLLVIEIQCDDSEGQRQAQDRVHGWLETFGYTASSHGFEFVSIGVATAKRLSKAPKRQL